LNVHVPGRSRGPGEPGDPLVGRLLDGRYEIGARIARGGMASVYEAVDTRLDRVCAIKVMHPGLGDDHDFAARFVREARSAAKLSHPNVVAVFDQGDDHGTVFLAMEYVAGHTLRDVIRKDAPMPPLRALALLEPVLSALASAHRAGLIHRDVKPENVLIADDGHGGRVKVADFGLAKAVSADTQHTATGGVLIGTVSYLAPELVVDGRADARADVYAAGVVLYELLTGHKPHEGESPIQVAYKHVHEDVPAPGAEVPGIPPYVDALVARATARDRSLRSADAGVFLHQLHMVRQALEEGVVDDPDLVADLRPAVSTGTAPIEVPDFADVPEPTVIRPVTEATTTIPPLTPGARVVKPAAVVRRPPRRSRRGPYLLIAALIAALLVAGLAWWFGAGRYTPTPSVIGLTQAEAQSKLRQAGLEADVGAHDYSETVATGRVISTDPGPGQRVLDGGTVHLVISLGKERYDVPVLRGKSVNAAQDAILAAHLSYGRAIGRWSDGVPAGTVLGSDPAAGTSLKPDTPVNIYVSRGPKPIEITDYTGQDAKVAEKALKKAGFKVEKSSDFSDTVPKDSVISQAPSSGAGHKGDVVTLVVSKGPHLVQIPNGIVASGVDAARSTLEGLGFQVEEQETDHYLGLGYVYSVTPGEGESAPYGSAVTLYLI
jgi:beta-lactam-binding protein with PASTA domain/serine/threonine protein kinase